MLIVMEITAFNNLLAKKYKHAPVMTTKRLIERIKNEIKTPLKDILKVKLSTEHLKEVRLIKELERDKLLKPLEGTA
jgi:hypothetical protein